MSDCGARISLIAPRPDLKGVNALLDAGPDNGSDGDKIAACLANGIEALAGQASFHVALPNMPDIIDDANDTDRVCEEAVLSLPYPWSQSVYRILELDRKAHSETSTSDASTERIWSGTVTALLDRIEAIRKKRDETLHRINAYADQLRAYADERVMDSTLDTDKAHVLDQHNAIMNRMNRMGDDTKYTPTTITTTSYTSDDAVQRAVSQCDLHESRMPSQHASNLRSIRQRELMQSFARQRLRDLVDSLQEKYTSSIDTGKEEARDAVVQLREMRDLQHTQSASIATAVAECVAQRRDAFSSIVSDQFGADEATRAKLHRTLLLINATRKVRRDDARREILNKVIPVAERLGALALANDESNGAGE